MGAEHDSQGQPLVLFLDDQGQWDPPYLVCILSKHHFVSSTSISPTHPCLFVLTFSLCQGWLGSMQYLLWAYLE